MKSKFNELFENMMSGGSESVFGVNADGEHGGATSNSDWYAPGDARIPKVLGAKKKKKKKKRRRRKDSYSKTTCCRNVKVLY